ncbi:MAG: macro domain-containing protein [Mogibacterium sp.]|nr:macro domain-containing protein [Mogibacterium sp.]
MALQIIRNNIINVEADAIVNTANPAVGVGRGVDYCIYEAAGWDRLLEAREKIGEMSPGEAVWTPAFDLHAKYIIHTVGPAWQGGSFGERETVARCYSNSMELAAKLGCESIAFPLIATGTYGFPKDEALRIAMAEISRFLLENEMEVLLVVYDKESFEVSGKLFSDIRSYIGDSETRYDAVYRSYMPGETSGPKQSGSYRVESPDHRRAKSSGRPGFLDRFLNRDREESHEAKGTLPELQEAPSIDADYDLLEDEYAEASYAPSFPSGAKSLEERLEHLDKTFQQYLFMLIDRRGLSDPDVYKKANIDRKHFSKIRSNVDYSPSKKTALALAIALELSLDETRDLLARAGLALSPSLVSDKIIEYCIETSNYDIYEINCILFKYEQPTLGV